jgi:hypothetical protein
MSKFIPVIKIKDGTNGEKKYYIWDTFDTYEEAIRVAKNIKEERKMEFKVKWFILKGEEGTLLMVPKVALYLNKKLRIW